MNITITKSSFQGFGIKKTENGIYFGCNLNFFNEGGIRFYDAKTRELVYELSLTEDYSYGNVYSFVLEGMDLSDKYYRLYSDSSEFPDAFSLSLAGNEIFGEPVLTENLYSSFDNFNIEQYMQQDRCPRLDYSDSVLYLCHVRGETMLDKSVKKKGTFAGLTEKISYFKNLGITALELMPCYEFLENNASVKAGIYNYTIDMNEPSKVNYWGFCDAFYFALKKGFSYSSNASKEFADLIIELHRNNMELIMMMYYPENIDREIVTASLRYYAMKYHVDGFRIMGCSFDPVAIIKDPFLTNTKLIFENCNISSRDKKSKFKNVALIKSEFIDKTRGFLKGDEDKVGFMSFSVRENNNDFAPIRLITDYHGFTLNDLVSYSKKHNEDNGEDNNDGTNYNYSWNCGAEGDTKKTLINKLRFCQAENAMLLTVLCQGVPQLRSGDECLNSAKGNNNPWCQDNETGWVSYSKSKSSKEFYTFIKNLLAFRKRHTVLHQAGELKLFDYMSCKLPDVSFHGEEAFKINQEPVSREFSVLYAGDYAKQYIGVKEDSVFIIYNMHWEDREFSLPVVDRKVKWYKLFSSDGSTDLSFDEEKAEEYTDDKYKAKGRSISIFLLRR